MKKQTTDIVAISEAVETYYFKGIYEGDTNALASIFYHGTLLFGDIQGQPYAKTLDQYLDGVQHRQPPKDSGKPFTGNIISINVINSIAVAKVRVEMYDFNYYDLLSFHKFGDRWMIVNKMLTDVAG